MRETIEEVIYLFNNGSALEVIGLFILSIFLVCLASTISIAFIKTFMGDDI